jgi:hypothetical protein
LEDPTPEYRPARADPIDMDDDEKEMIAEARVRLANIKGKKAKRIAREKVLDEARRLAQLQKFRELKSAGIDFVIERKRRKKKHEFNYEDEVPLERQPFEAVFSTKEEKMVKQGDLNLGNITINQLEGKRRDEEELQKRKEDLRRVKKLREMDLPNRIQRANALNPMNYIAKRELELEKPQLGDEDIEELAKLSKRAGDYSETIEGQLKRVKRPTDFLLQDNCMDEIQTIVGQTVTPSTGGDLMAKAREILEVSDPDYVSRNEDITLDSKDNISLNSYFTSGLSMKGSTHQGQMNLEQFDKSGAKKTVNPYKELVKSIRNEGKEFNTPGKKEESVYSVQSMSVMSKLNDHLSINNPWMNLKKIETEQSLADPSEFQRSRMEWNQMSEKKKKRRMMKMIQKEFDNLPEKDNDFEVDFSELAEEFEMEKQNENEVNVEPETSGKIRIKEKEEGFLTKASKSSRRCAESIKNLIGLDEKAELKSKFQELENNSTPEEELERMALGMMGENLSISDMSLEDSDNEEIPTEFYEKAEMLLWKENEVLRNSIDEVMTMLNQDVFTEEFYLEKGLNKELLAQRLEVDYRQKVANKIEFESKKVANKAGFDDEFNKVGILF